ncbi:hypothetical protein CLV35_0207 [Motilibacter peucedani]|uniref:O-antigen ligase n=1 Tax=Motilibacter peucedani TaxID=598650 RepID=A0A420XVP7_9ACTN|nr:hypothetical protein [Motilibacter peucedani]RKS80739.1 hypothetical protein CLV35_0207 [Motilibacter peucedani]
MSAPVLERPFAFPVRLPTSGLAAVCGPRALLPLGVASAAVVGAAATLGPLAGLAAVVAVLGALAVVARPALAGLVLAWVVPLTPGLRRGLLVPGFKVSEVVAVGLGALVLLTVGRQEHARWRVFDWVALAYVVLTVALGVAGLLRRGAPLTGDISTLVSPVQFFLAYRVVRITLPTPELRTRALRGTLLASLVVTGTVLLQLGPGPGGRLLSSLTGVAYTGRATGLYSHWHDLAGYAFLIIVVGVALLLTPGQRVLPPPLLVGVVLANLLSLVASLTIIAMIGTLLAAVVLGVRKGRVVQLLGVLVASVAVATAAFGPTLVTRLSTQFSGPAVGTTGGSSGGFLPHSLAYRLEVWTTQYGPALKPHLLAGYGPGIPPEVNWKFTESLYLTLLLRGGVPLLAAFAFWCLFLWTRARRAEGSVRPEESALGHAMSAIVLGTIVMDISNPYFVNNGFPHALWVLAGLLAVPTPLRSASWPRPTPVRSSASSSTTTTTRASSG